MEVVPSNLDFGALPMGFDGELSISVSNRASDPHSMLRIVSINVTGDGFSLLRGPAMPDTILGGLSTDPVVVRFSPSGHGDAHGVLRIVPSNAESFDITLRGGGPPEETDIVEDIELGPANALVFRSIQGDFDLGAGETLHFEWTGGVIFLNGKRYLPPHSLREFSQWRGPFTRAELLQYANVPFMRERIAAYGDTDAGWFRAYSEWDSTKMSLMNAVGSFHGQHHTFTECAEYILREDRAGMIESARAVEVDGIEVVWRGVTGAEVIALPWRPRGPDIPRPVPRRTAERMLSTLRSFLGEREAYMVELLYGDFSAGPSSNDDREPLPIKRGDR
jgi:hypothetical protein